MNSRRTLARALAVGVVAAIADRVRERVKTGAVGPAP